MLRGPALRLALLGYRGGQFEYLRLLQAQQARATSSLEYNQVLLDAWFSASTIAGLLSES